MIKNRRDRISNIHFVGIGGSGMCGIAEILHRQGANITGSDEINSPNCQRLSSLGIDITIGHKKRNIKNANAVVVSSAIDESNKEIIAAREASLPIVPRAVMLGELMRYKSGIAVAGTHGKTTTTSMLASIFQTAGLDPTYVVGGRLLSIGSNAYLGKGQFLITEADESDASFIHLQPQISIVTNIEYDHMVNYDNDRSKYNNIFLQFLHNLPFYGLAILCLDDPVINSLLPSIARPTITYGFSEHANYTISNYQQDGVQANFEVKCPDDTKLDIQLELPGKHNALNATASIAAARDIGIADNAIIDGLKQFHGVGRRFEVLGKFPPPAEKNNKSIVLLDDYGHHPTEINCNLRAARAAWPDRRLVMLFQPHRFSRTRDLYDEFVDILVQPDLLILMKTYPAGEKAISGFESKNLATGIRQLGNNTVVLVNSLEKLDELLPTLLKDGDLLITQGAGNIGAVASNLARSKLQTASLGSGE